MPQREDDDAPLCRCCGRAIAPKTTMVYAEPGTLRTKAECQSLENDRGTVMGVAYRAKDAHPSVAGTVWRYWVWDGKTYLDKHFCDSKCRDKFAHAAALKGFAMPDYLRAQRER